MSQTNNPNSQSDSEPLYRNPLDYSKSLDLSRTTFHLVQGFTCGRTNHPEEIYEQDVSEWITDATTGALYSVEKGLMEIKLFLHDDGRLLGYGAIGLDQWVIENQQTTLWLIHYAGIHTDFRGQKGVPPAERFGRRLLGGLIEEIERRGGCDLMALFVDPVNPARRLYEEFGFVELDNEVDGDRTWVRMIRRLQPPPTL